MDQTKKTMRHFYCRDVLWETFEAMANDFDCSIDYLVNESMRLYARSKNYQVPGGGSPSQIIPSGSSGHSGAQSGSALRPAIGTPSPSALRSTSTSQQMPRPITSPAVPAAPAPPPRPPAALLATTPRAMVNPPPPPAPMPAPPSFTPAQALTPTPSQVPAPASNWSPPLSAASAQPGGESSALLYLVFNGQRHVVDKEQFVIGRGSKTADLPIKDGNISRQHAVVLRRNGVYYIKDLGSTNGIEYKGMRIDNKRIDEGDTFYICDYELKFTYQPH